MSDNTIDCSDLNAIANAFAPTKGAREGLTEAIRMYGAHRYEAGELAGIRRAVEILKNNPVPVACFRLAEIIEDSKP